MERPRIDGFPLLFESPGLMVFLHWCLNPSTTQRTGEKPTLAPPGVPSEAAQGGPRAPSAFGKGQIFQSNLCTQIQLGYFN